MTKLEQVVEELISRGFAAEVTEVSKVNSVRKGIIFLRDTNDPCPVIYEDLLEGNNIKELADCAIRLNKEFLERLGNEKLELSRDYILQNSFLDVCRSDWNSKLLENVEFRQIGNTDLAVFIRLKYTDAMTCKVSKGMFEAFNLSWDELYEAALKNQEYTITDMNYILHKYRCDMTDEEMPQIKMLILSNESRCKGASVICNNYILDEASQMLGSDSMYIIPSSIHEVMCVPDGMRREDVNSMIVDVNWALLEEDEKLSDHCYIYDGKEITNG